MVGDQCQSPGLVGTAVSTSSGKVCCVTLQKMAAEHQDVDVSLETPSDGWISWLHGAPCLLEEYVSRLVSFNKLIFYLGWSEEGLLFVIKVPGDAATAWSA